MKKPKTVNLMDVTLREGNYMIEFQLKPKDVVHLVDHIDHAGIGYIEVSNVGASYPHGITDFDYIEAAKSVVKKAKLGALVTPAAPSNSGLSDFEKACSILDYVRIGTNVHEVPSAARWVEKAKEHGLLTFFQLMRSPAFSPSRVAAAARRAEKMGANVIYIVDTMGSLTPQTVKEYVKAVKSEVSTPLGFHAHNNLGLAIANSLEAARSGCQWLDASLLGAGRQAGNAQLETLALLLQREGYHAPFDMQLLLDTAELLAAPIFKNYKGVEPYDVWTAFLNLDLYPRWVYKQMAILVGLDTKSFIKEISKLKNFVVMDDDHFNALCKRFNIPFDKMLNAMQSAPDIIRSSY